MLDQFVRNAVPVLGLALALLLRRATTAAGEVGADQLGAVLVYPYIVVDSSTGTDTLVQLTNTGTAPVGVRCFYVPGDDTATLTKAFVVRLTGRQPIAWRVRTGLSNFPLDGVTRVGPNGSSNAGSNVPPVSPDPFSGSLRCVVVDDADSPTDQNVLIGQATVEHYQASLPAFDAAVYNAIGIAAVPGANNRDNQLMLGGPNPEYDACPSTVILDHFTDGARLPAHGSIGVTEVFTTVTLIPCGEQVFAPTSSTDHVQFTEFNEFEQRFQISTGLRSQLVQTLSNIDTEMAQQSIFYVSVQGTLTGQLQLVSQGISVARGLLAVAIERHHVLGESGRVTTAGVNTHLMGQRASGDVLDLSGLFCLGDCDDDGVVRVDELVRGVNIGLGNLPPTECAAFDGNRDQHVTVD